MNATRTVSPGRAATPRRWLTWLMLILTLTLVPGSVRADGPDDDYLAITSIIDEANALNDSGKTAEALAKYIQAERALSGFQKNNPLWNPATVKYRLNQLVEKVTGVSAEPPAPVRPMTMSATATAATAAETTTKSASKSVVKVLSNGSEPRTALKFHPTVGDNHDMAMTLKMSMTMGLAGKAMPTVNIPAMNMTIGMDIKKIAANGDVTYEMVIKDATVADDPTAVAAVATAMKATLAKFNGITGTGTMTDHGIIKSIDMKLGEAPDAQTSQTLSQMKDSFNSSSFALPEEPVGAGARWEYKSRIKSQGMSIDQTIAYELVSVDGDHLSLNTTLTQTAANQKITNPAMPGLKVDLTKMIGNGSGKSTVDLSQMCPVSATLDEDIDIGMGMNIGQQKQSMDMKMTMNIGFTTK